MYRAVMLTGPSGASRRYRPSAPDIAVCVEPSTDIVAPISGTELPATVTVPVISRVWPNAACGSATTAASTSTDRLLRTEPPGREKEVGDSLPFTRAKGAGGYIDVKRRYEMYGCCVNRCMGLVKHRCDA